MKAEEAELTETAATAEGAKQIATAEDVDQALLEKEQREEM